MKGIKWSLHTCLDSLRAKWKLQVVKVESACLLPGHCMPRKRHVPNHMPNTQGFLIRNKI